MASLCSVRIDTWMLWGLSVVVLIVSVSSQEQNGARRQRQRPANENGGGLAFIMDNWLFRQPPAPPASSPSVASQTAAETKETSSSADNGNNTPITYTETNWNQPVSFNSKEKVNSQKQPTETSVITEGSSETFTEATDVSISSKPDNTSESVQPDIRDRNASEPSPLKHRTTARRVKVTSTAASLSGSLGPRNGDVRLDGGDVEGTGNVFIYSEGEWGAICDDGWNIHSANVVCKQLGHPHALGQTNQAYFGEPDQAIKLDNVQCFGDEKTLLDCHSAPWGTHDCDIREAAGVFCAPKDLAVTTTTTTTRRPTTVRRRKIKRIKKKRNGTTAAVLRKKGLQALHVQADDALNQVPQYKMRVAGGRNPKEGRLEVRVGGRWGVICAKPWTLREATVACRHLKLGYAQMAVVGTAFGGERFDKVLNGIKCKGHEQNLYDCFHEEINNEVECNDRSLIAGIICTNLLPDLVPNGTMLEVSTYLDDVPMYYMTCAMEENCAAPSAYRIKQRYRDWRQQRRRLMRFSSSTWNFGTADFRPFINKELWEWHSCHMHYHSMEVFATYDILDLHGNKVADGHKASFCLEDVECMPGASKRYECVGYSDQGISVGCADNYLHNIDCQWVDITDMQNGNYIFRIHINPERMVPELSFENNAATCNLEYNGYEVYVTDCVVGNGEIHKG